MIQDIFLMLQSGLRDNGYDNIGTKVFSTGFILKYRNERNGKCYEIQIKPLREVIEHD